MWLLVFVLLNPSLDEPGITVLARFATRAACQIDRDRIGRDMAEAYPQEPHTFRIECRWRSRQWKA